MNIKLLPAHLGRFACVSLLAAGCASPDTGRSDASLWSRLKPRSPRPQVAAESGEVKLKDPAALHLAYGRWREQVGDAEDARVSYESVLREDSKNVDALVGLARLDALAGRHDEADRRLARALRLEPGNARVLAAQGQLFAARNRWQDAVNQLNAAVLAAPNTAEYRYQLAVALARSGDGDAALPHFTRTVGPAEAHYNVGYILYEQGRTREAERHLVEALRQRSDLHVAQAMLDELRGERASLSAPAVVAHASRPQPNWAAEKPAFAPAAPSFAHAATTSPRPARSPNVPPAIRRTAFPDGQVADGRFTDGRFADSRFADGRFSDSRSADLAGIPDATPAAAANVRPPTSWYPTQPSGPDEPTGLTAAQREQMLNQRMVDSLRFSDGAVRR